jgi:hypothetical protein
MHCWANSGSDGSSKHITAALATSKESSKVTQRDMNALMPPFNSKKFRNRLLSTRMRNERRTAFSAIGGGYRLIKYILRHYHLAQVHAERKESQSSAQKERAQHSAKRAPHRRMSHRVYVNVLRPSIEEQHAKGAQKQRAVHQHHKRPSQRHAQRLRLYKNCSTPKPHAGLHQRTGDIIFN